MSFNFPNSLIHKDAKILKIFGYKGFDYFNDFLKSTEQEILTN